MNFSLSFVVIVIIKNMRRKVKITRHDLINEDREKFLKSLITFFILLGSLLSTSNYLEAWIVDRTIPLYVYATPGFTHLIHK